MDRKNFIKKAIGALLICLLLISLIGCSSDDFANGDPNIDPDASDCLDKGANATSISSNHGHTLVVSKADIDTGTEKSYSIQGSSGHNHNITLTSSNFNTLKTTKSIRVESSRNSSHRHDLTVSCA